MCISSDNISAGHPTGMLDRDQRTMFIPKFRRSAISINESVFLNNHPHNNQNSLSTDCCQCGNSSPSKSVKHCDRLTQQVQCSCNSDQSESDQLYCSKRNLRLSTVKKTNVQFVFCSILLLIVLLSPLNCEAKPFEHRSPLPSIQHYLTHPCGLMESSSAESSKETFNDADLREMFRVISQQTANALIDANASVKKYLEITWDRSDVEEFNSLWQRRQQKWLYPDGKEMIELFHDVVDSAASDIDTTQLTMYANITKLLLDTDNRFQRLTLGFQQIITQHKDLKARRLTDNRVIDLFTTSLHNLRMVLCEVRTLINRMGLPQTIVSVNEMSDEDRSDDLLDWIILREYVNQLKYLKQEMDVLRHNKIYLQTQFL